MAGIKINPNVKKVDETSEMTEEELQEAVAHLSDGATEPEVEELEASEVQTTGLVIEDKQGHRWTIPDESYEDLTDLGAKHQFENLKYDPLFHYQLIRAVDLADYETRGFVAVTNEEVGLKNTLDLEYGKPTSTIVHRLDAVMVKIPKILNERNEKRKAMVAKAVVDACEPTEEMLERAKRSAAPRMKRSMAFQDGKTPMDQQHNSKKSEYLTR